MPAVFENRYVTRINGTNVKQGKTKRRPRRAAPHDIRELKSKHGLDRVVCVWCASTETYIKAGPQHATVEQFEKAMDRNDDAIAPSMLYAWACIMEGVAFANGAPNLAVDTPALIELASSAGSRSPARISRPADVDEDGDRAGPQGENSSDSPVGTRRTSWATAMVSSRFAGGALFWTDFLYDDHGATGVPVDIPTGGLTPPRGTYVYPAGPAARNGADIFRVAVGLTETDTWWRIDWNTLLDPSVPIALFTFDTDRGQRPPTSGRRGRASAPPASTWRYSSRLRARG